MMKKVKFFLSFLLVLPLEAGYFTFPTNASTYASAAERTGAGLYAGANDSAQTKQLLQADPTIFVDNTTYYLYGTNESDASQGFKVFTSKDLVHWVSPDGNSDRFALKKGDSFGTGGFWAPQVFSYDGAYYMAYVANEQIAIAKSDSPLGPFTQSSKQALLPNSTYKTIDPYVFFDDDGQKYLYYVEENGGNNLCVAKLKDDLSGIDASTKKGCIRATEQWENTANASWPVTEGPTVIKEQGTYYLFYSANDFRNPDYAVGYATSSSPLGPWTKHNGPIISKNYLHVNGTGHGDVFADQNNQLYYVFHTHNTDNQPTPRKTAIAKLSFTPQNGGAGLFAVDASSFYYLQQYPNDPVQTAIDAIDALPSADAVTLGDEAAVTDAENLFDALTDTQKAQVTNAGKLTDCQAKMAALKDEDAARKVIDAINALPEANSLQLSDESAVTSAQNLYDSLTDDQQALVTNFNVLTAAEKQIEELKSSGNSTSQPDSQNPSDITSTDTSHNDTSVNTTGTDANTPSEKNPHTGVNGIIPAIALLACSFGSAVVIKAKKRKKSV